MFLFYVFQRLEFHYFRYLYFHTNFWALSPTFLDRIDKIYWIHFIIENQTLENSCNHLKFETKPLHPHTGLWSKRNDNKRSMSWWTNVNWMEESTLIWVPSNRWLVMLNADAMEYQHSQQKSFIVWTTIEFEIDPTVELDCIPICDFSGNFGFVFASII